MATSIPSGGHSYNKEFFALNYAAKRCQKYVELKVFRQAVGQPFLLQLVSFFKTEVCSSYLNVSVFRHLLILKFTMTINI